MTEQEKDQILADYAESFRLRLWRRTCRETTRKDIESGCDTWERIAEVAAEYRREKGDLAELLQAAASIAGHIRQPMTAREIADALNSGDYNAELILQHLLRLVSDR